MVLAKHIAVIGSPGSGKSIFSAALAKEMIKRKQRAIIVSGDHVIPMLPFFAGDCDICGIGRLCAGEITPASVAQSIRISRKYPDIGVMGLQFDDDPGTVSDGQLTAIAQVLDHLTDVVIWDGLADLNGVFDQTILRISDIQICILTPDIKGILYFENYRPTLRKQKNYLFLEGAGRPYSIHEEMHGRVGGFDGSLPFSREIERVCLEGEVFSVDKVCHKIYLETAERIADRILTGKEG